MFLIQVFVIAYSVIKKVTLPRDGTRRSAAHVAFKCGQGRPHVRVCWERDERMQVIRHQQHQTTVPLVLLLSIRSRFEYNCRDVIVTELVFTAWLETDCNEEGGSVFDPGWDQVPENLTAWSLVFSFWHAGA